MSADRLASIVQRMRSHIEDVAGEMMSPKRSAREAALIATSARDIRQWADELEAIANEGDR